MLEEIYLIRDYICSLNFGGLYPYIPYILKKTSIRPKIFSEHAERFWSQQDQVDCIIRICVHF